jgi:dienelactone hydrolase
MTDFDAHTIETTTHGRYLVRRGPDENLLVGFHGYAENAETHLRELAQIPGSDEWTLVAVQGLNRFYAGRSQLIVASWMTSEDRELAIADNIAYVQRVLTQFPAARRIVFAGFSQGVAMAYRAAAAIPAAAVIALGGDLPPDIVPVARSLPVVLIGRGLRDEWYTDEKLKQDMSYLPAATKKVFDGGHEWTAGFRLAAGELLASLTGKHVDQSAR